MHASKMELKVSFLLPSNPLLSSLFFSFPIFLTHIIFFSFLFSAQTKREIVNAKSEFKARFIT